MFGINRLRIQRIQRIQTIRLVFPIGVSYNDPHHFDRPLSSFCRSFMPLSWNEIKARAVSFSKEWSGEQRENAEAQTFWNEFFEVFGVRRRLVASFEKKVQSIKGTFGFIDLLWSGRLLAEHKSFGKSLEKAALQAFDYIQALKNENREDDAPRYVVVSDFAKIVLYDLEPEEDDPRF